MAAGRPHRRAPGRFRAGRVRGRHRVRARAILRRAPCAAAPAGSWGLILTGVLGVAMLAAAVSGLLMHRHLIRDIFTLRPGAQRLVSRRDLHTVAGTWILPHAFVLAFTGAFFSFAISIGVPCPGQDRIQRRSDGDDRDVDRPSEGHPIRAPRSAQASIRSSRTHTSASTRRSPLFRSTIGTGPTRISRSVISQKDVALTLTTLTSAAQPVHSSAKSQLLARGRRSADRSSR